jgi:hypothetical protein
MDEEFCLLGYNAVQSIESELRFWRNNMSLSTSGLKIKPGKKPT